MQPIWSPSEARIKRSEMTRFQQYIATSSDRTIANYTDLHRFSIDHNESFWTQLMAFYEVIGEGDLHPVCEGQGFEEYGWFPNYRLNFAENLLSKGHDADCAIHFIHESGKQSKTSYAQLKQSVAGLQAGLKALIRADDVLACYMPNIPETVISMLAVTGLGGIFTSTSCDFGVAGVVDRFEQSDPKVLVSVTSYQYNGKTHSLLPKLEEIARRLPNIEKIVLVDFLENNDDISHLDAQRFISWQDFIQPQEQPDFIRKPFASPLYIMYSSGTTGKPKCIVHSAGGTLLQHLKELGLHSDLTAEKSILYFTTCGWMMWNWLVSSLAFGSRLCLYEGSPGYPSLPEFFEIIDREKINIFGTSPKFLKALEDSGYQCDLPMPHFETLLSTGAPLLPEQYDYIYEKLNNNICVSSIAGGTDIIGCFMLGNPNLPVYPGEIQCLGLGMDVAALDDNGNALINHEGELVCRKSFPSRPIYFLNDENNERINDAYFNQFPGFWTHGDFVKITDYGTVIVYGRSDATLNPGGVRIGTAEIYRQTEGLSWIEDSLCVGRPNAGDVDVVLFVKLNAGEQLTPERIVEIKQRIKAKTTPRHVPQNIWPVTDIPYTRSGKKMELAVSRILANREIKNIEAVANPDCLKQYEAFQTLK